VYTREREGGERSGKDKIVREEQEKGEYRSLKEREREGYDR